jgi:hypothetical protein
MVEEVETDTISAASEVFRAAVIVDTHRAGIH